jgi:hypothetical protein
VLAYALAIVAVNRVQHIYSSTLLPALEELRIRELPLNTLFQVPDPRLDALLGHGWYGAEAGGIRWSAGLSSVLALPAQDAETDLIVLLRLAVAGDDEHTHHRVRIFANGHELGALDAQTNTVGDYTVPMPAAVHQGYPSLLTLNYEYCLQPGGADQRNIAVRLEAMMLTADANNPDRRM